jgi:MFS family permease
MENLIRTTRRITLTLFIVQCLSSAAFIAASTLNAIVGARMNKLPGGIGMPAAVFLLSSALSAYLWGYLMDIIGRRGGLLMGLLLGALGSALAFYSVIFSHWLIFLLGLIFVGFASSVIRLSRFTAAEVNPPAMRGRAISSVVLGGTVGAVIGPQLVDPLGRGMYALGFDELSGAYVAGVGLFLIAFAIILVGLRPEPRDLGKKIAELYPEPVNSDAVLRDLKQILKQPAAVLAILAMVLSQFVMVVVLAVVSIYLNNNQYALVTISLIISVHTLGMYAFSYATGGLADRLGRVPIILVGAAMLIASCLGASLANSIVPFAISLFFVGLGWNMCFISGSALLADQLQPAERTRTQGFNDLLIGLSASLASFTGGLIYDYLGFAPITWLGALIAAVLFAAVLAWLQLESPILRRKQMSKDKKQEGCQSEVHRWIRGRQVKEPC